MMSPEVKMMIFCREDMSMLIKWLVEKAKRRESFKWPVFVILNENSAMMRGNEDDPFYAEVMEFFITETEAFIKRRELQKSY